MHRIRILVDQYGDSGESAAGNEIKGGTLFPIEYCPPKTGIGV